MSDEWLKGDFDDAIPASSAPGEPIPLNVAAKPEFVREIDLGDGSGKQVFRGANEQELIDKLYEAQVNATKKIQELARQAVQPPPQEYQMPAPQWEPPAPLTAEEEFALGQQFATNPSATWKRLFEANTGVSVDQIPQIVQHQEEQRYLQQSAIATDAFLRNHQQDYHPCPENHALFKNFLAAQGLDWSLPNLEYAHSSLVRSGLLVGPPPDESPNSPFPQTITDSVAPATPSRSNREAEVRARLANMTADEVRAAIKSGAI